MIIAKTPESNDCWTNEKFTSFQLSHLTVILTVALSMASIPRDFPSPSRPDHVSVYPVAAIQRLAMKIKPNAVISGHTWGRVYLTPYGDKMPHQENKDDYDRIVGQMAKQSGYRMMRACDMYKTGGLNNPPIRVMGEGEYGLPINGTEVDWYYRNGSFSIVMEFGTHQRIPTTAETKFEFEKTWSAFLHFVKEGPLVKNLRSSSQ